MSLEVQGWYNDLKNGPLMAIVNQIITASQRIVKLLSLLMVIIGMTVLSGVYMLETDAGYLIPLLVDMTLPSGQVPEVVKSFRNINQDGSFNDVILANYNCFSFVTAAGMACFACTFFPSKRTDLTCIFLLLVCLMFHSQELKAYDTVLAPAQNSTMFQLRKTLIERPTDLPNDYYLVLDYIMYKGQCCGIIAASDIAMVQVVRVEETTPYSQCWRHDNSQVGCYVYFFENYIQPTVRGLHGVVMLSEMIIITILSMITDIPTTREMALKLSFFERMPTPFPID